MSRSWRNKKEGPACCGRALLVPCEVWRYLTIADATFDPPLRFPLESNATTK
jgi:hypothetical protein